MAAATAAMSLLCQGCRGRQRAEAKRQGGDRQKLGRKPERLHQASGY
jgi:hypothetical protein